MSRTEKFVLLGIAALACSACATGVVDPERDPYESFNRDMYAVNDGLDRAILEPTAKGYRAVTNEPVRSGVRNFVGNLAEPKTFANQVLQGQVVPAASTVGRFVVNTTLGVVGIFDPATSMGLERRKEDFGQTLGVWGMASGPYLVLPVIGSTSPRDLVGFGVDLASNPLNFAQFDGDDATRVGVLAARGISAREDAIEVVDDLRATRLDPYSSVRRYHVISRASEIGNREIAPNEIQEVQDYELDF